MSLYISPCMQRGPNFTALRTPFQAGTGWGAFQRNGPTGGAAKGMPLNAVTPLLAAPFTRPVSTFTVSGTAAGSSVAAARNRVNLGCMHITVTPGGVIRSKGSELLSARRVRSGAFSLLAFVLLGLCHRFDRRSDVRCRESLVKIIPCIVQLAGILVNLAQPDPCRCVRRG